MSGGGDKQVQEALQAIKKLVEQSEDQLSTADEVLTLDNVVWRNPVKDEDEAIDELPKQSVPEQSLPAVTANNTPAQKSPVDSADVADVADVADTEKSYHAPQASLSVSARDLEQVAAKRARPKAEISTPTTSPLDLNERVEAPSVSSSPSPAVPSSVVPSPAPRTSAPIIAKKPAMAPVMTPVPDDELITDLTSPLGRKGGGFYNGQKPLLQTQPLPPQIAPISVKETEQSTPNPKAELPANEPANEPVNEPGATDFNPGDFNAGDFNVSDFQGADFNFSAAEGLISAASFAELKQAQTRPITPEIHIATVEPALSDPVGEVQAMYQDQKQDASNQEPSSQEYEAEDEMFEPTSHPNLHVVSDSSAVAEEDEEEGFSGAVRLALRSIIKEQVSTWLQGNMTGLIEEALTSPQKRPSSSTKPTSKKR